MASLLRWHGTCQYHTTHDAVGSSDSRLLPAASATTSQVAGIMRSWTYQLLPLTLLRRCVGACEPERDPDDFVSCRSRSIHQRYCRGDRQHVPGGALTQRQASGPGPLPRSRALQGRPLGSPVGSIVAPPDSRPSDPLPQRQERCPRRPTRSCTPSNRRDG